MDCTLYSIPIAIFALLSILLLLFLGVFGKGTPKRN